MSAINIVAYVREKSAALQYGGTDPSNHRIEIVAVHYNTVLRNRYCVHINRCLIFRCTLLPGAFFLVADADECADAIRRSNSSSLCGDHEQCVNTIGSYICRPTAECVGGFSVDPVSLRCVGKSLAIEACAVAAAQLVASSRWQTAAIAAASGRKSQWSIVR
jgi:Calcium-binding EGF domain